MTKQTLSLQYINIIWYSVFKFELKALFFFCWIPCPIHHCFVAHSLTDFFYFFLEHCKQAICMQFKTTNIEFNSSLLQKPLRDIKTSRSIFMFFLLFVLLAVMLSFSFKVSGFLVVLVFHFIIIIVPFSRCCFFGSAVAILQQKFKLNCVFV